jgi:glycosyltransferase involved in cell wall biosynthesis
MSQIPFEGDSGRATELLDAEMNPSSSPIERATSVEAGDLAALRVLVVTVSAGGVGGMQQHTHDLVRGLVAAGHDVEVVCPAADGLASDLYGARWNLLETTGRYDPRWSSELAATFRAAHSRAPVDVIHSESTSAAPLTREKLQPPIVVTYHGNYLGLARAHLRRAARQPWTGPKEIRRLARMTWRFFRDRNAWAFRGCETMVVSRQQLRNTARSSLTRRNRVHVVPNGVDVDLFRPRDREGTRHALGIDRGFVLTAVGRLNREKGFDVALSALARIAPDRPDMRLVIVGGGEERDRLERLARRLDVIEHVTFVGHQPLEKVAEYLAAADVFVFPTLRDEAGPLVLPQAMACALPVVASRIGGITEVLREDGDSPAGLLVRPGSIPEVEAAIRLLADDPALRMSLGLAARARVVHDYSIEAMVTRTVAVYRTAIARSREAQWAARRNSASYET